MAIVVSMLIAALAAAAAIIVAIAKTAKKRKQEINRLSEELSKQKNVSLALQQYCRELAEICGDKSETDKKIYEAKTNEEILDIIGDSLRANNDRVRKQ